MLVLLKQRRLAIEWDTVELNLTILAAESSISFIWIFGSAYRVPLRLERTLLVNLRLGLHLRLNWLLKLRVRLLEGLL